MGFHRPLPAWCDAADASETERARGIRDPLFPRFRAAGETVPPADGLRARGASRPARRPRRTARKRDSRADSGCRLRDRPPRTVSRSEEKGEGRKAGRLARLVQHALPGAFGAGEGAAFRLLRRSLWREKRGGDDRRGAGAERLSYRPKRPAFSFSPRGRGAAYRL